MKIVSVLVVDDHRVVSEGIVRILEDAGGFDVLGTAASLNEAAVLVTKFQPNIILLDLRLPDSRGYLAVTRMRELSPEAKIVAMTGYGDIAREDALKHGADAFLTKDRASGSLVEVLRQLSSGSEMAPVPRLDLTRRELDVAILASQGLTNQEIASALSVSVNTVKTHLSSSLQKLSATNRTELASKLHHWVARG